MNQLAFAGILLATLAAVATFFFVLGGAALLRRRWRNGVLNLAGAVASTVVLFLGLEWVARSLISVGDWTKDIDPQAKARFFAESIAGLMNVIALGLPTGILAGALILWRRRVRERTR